MKSILVISCLILVVLSVHGAEEREVSKTTSSVKEKPTESDTKDKRQIGSRETAVYPNVKQDDPEQPQETIYGSKANPFLIRPLSPHEQQLRNYQPTSRPQSHQLQALGPQLEQSQEIQHFAYLQDINRHHQAKAATEGKSHILPKKPTGQLQTQYVADEQYAQSLQPQAQHNAVPPQYLSQQPQQQQPQFQSIQEEHLLKLIEEELQARALQEAQSRAAYAKPSTPTEQQGLGSYRSKPEEAPEYIRYSQQEQPIAHQGPQYLPLTGQQPIRSQPQSQQQLQAREQPQNFYQGPSALSYRTLPNHPLAESSLEREIEKLLASNKPTEYRHSHPPAVLSTRSPFIQKKAYSTTASPLTTIAQASQYSFNPSVVQYSGFQPSPTVPSVSIEQPKKFVPNTYSTAQPQYGIQTSPAPPKPNKSFSVPGQYNIKQQQKSKLQLKQNLGPVQFYYNDLQHQQQQQQQQHQQHQQHQQQQHQQQQHQQQQQSHLSLQSPEYPQYPIPSNAPSQSSIFVSQSTGLRPSQKPKPASKPLGLPPANGKPISQAEFQALIDAGYPVEAVPVPVPVPYEQYIKQHPEYNGQHVEVPHRHAHRGVAGDGSVTYLRPLPHERQQQHQPRHPREQTEEVVAGKNTSS